HLHGSCKYPPIPVSRVLHQDRHEGSFQDKRRSFVRRKRMYMDSHNDIRDVLTCRQDCIPISFWDIQTSWYEACSANETCFLPVSSEVMDREDSRECRFHLQYSQSLLW